jgi:hypothetical protein
MKRKEQNINIKNKLKTEFMDFYYRGITLDNVAIQCWLLLCSAHAVPIYWFFNAWEISHVNCYTRSYYRKESAASSPMDQSQHVQFAE